MRFAIRSAFLLALVAAGAIGSCYAHGPNPPPCPNVETCNDPTTLPPIWDDRKPDAGKGDAR